MTLVYRISLTRLGRLSDYTLILSGIAIAALFGSLTSFLIFISEGDELRKIIFWMLGRVPEAWHAVLPLFLVVATGALLIQIFARDLNALMLGDEMAMHLGIDPQHMKKIFLLLATVLTTSVVSLAGTIGFVGLIVPHTMRLILGPDHRLLLPAAGLGGAAFLVFCDTMARTIAPAEVPVGIITALFGAPFLLYLLRRSPAQRAADSQRGRG